MRTFFTRLAWTCIVVIVVAGIAFLLSGCAVEGETDNERMLRNRGIIRFHDDELNVTCWRYEGYKEGGLSCIPDHMLTP